MNIYGFYHVLLRNDWKKIVNDQLLSLKQSMLLDKTKKIFVCCLGKVDDAYRLRNLLLEFEKNKFEIVYYNQNEKLYEFCTLDILYKLSSYEDFLCFYFHAKGSSIGKNNCREYYFLSLNILKKNIRDWRVFMEYFCFYKYFNNINFLENSNYDCCGVNFRTEPFPHFSGNFWWSKSEHIRCLPNPMNFLETRANAEFWLFMKKNTIHINHFNCDDAGYRKTINPGSYM